jgi:hypothetical protein
MLFADPKVHPSAPASSCTPSTPLYTDFLFLLTAPLGLENPPPGVPVADRTRRWLDMIAATARFLRSTNPVLSPATPSHACFNSSTADTHKIIHSLEGPSAAITSVLMSSPFVPHWPHPPFRVSCRSPQFPCMSGASDQVTMTGFPFLVCSSLPPCQPSAHAASASAAEAMMKLTFGVMHTIVLKAATTVRQPSGKVASSSVGKA